MGWADLEKVKIIHLGNSISYMRAWVWYLFFEHSPPTPSQTVSGLSENRRATKLKNASLGGKVSETKHWSSRFTFGFYPT